MPEQAAAYQPHCYGLWIVVASLQPTWQGQYARLAMGIICLASAPAHG